VSSVDAGTGVRRKSQTVWQASARRAVSGGLPLSGITVADFSWVLAGPRATSWLGAMGARVIKIEGPTRPDQYRATAIFVPGKEDITEGSGAFHSLNHTKLQCSIDFTHPRGLELAKQIVAMSDVVVENFSYGVMERAGLGYEDLKQIKPDIIMVSSSAMGKTGPDKNHIAYGTLIHAFSGINSVTGYNGELGSVGGTYSDPLVGTTMVFAILAALWHRKRTGEGQKLDLSMVEATMMQLPEYVLDYTANGRVASSHGNSYGIASPHDTFRCAGHNKWVAISVTDQEEWTLFCHALGDPSWCQDERFSDQLRRFENRDALYDYVAEWTSTRDVNQVVELLQSFGVAAGPSYNSEDMYNDPNMQARGMFPEVEHPFVGVKPIWALPWLMDGRRQERYWAAPTFGQDTDFVLRDLLGVSEDEIASLREQGVVV
jgi:benzylsuccinate CoA-transferase BbsF subunit